MTNGYKVVVKHRGLKVVFSVWILRNGNPINPPIIEGEESLDAAKHLIGMACLFGHEHIGRTVEVKEWLK